MKETHKYSYSEDGLEQVLIELEDFLVLASRLARASVM
jgi:hypothetical protein